MHERFEGIDHCDVTVDLAVIQVFGVKYFGARNMGGCNDRAIPIA
jgi:hypothetical protein